MDWKSVIKGDVIVLILLGIVFLVIGVPSIILGLQELDWMWVIAGIICSGLGILSVKAKFNEVDENNIRRLTKISINEERKRFLTKRNLIDSKWVSDLNYTICSIDEQKKEVWFFYLDDKLNYTTLKNYTYEDILEVEVLVDGETITKTSRGSQLGGALLGGVLAGGVGAVIGGLSGSTTSQEKVGSIQLKITVNDIKNPVILLKIFNTSTPWDKNDEELKQYSETAMEWQGLFSVIIKNGDKKVEAKAETENTSDEIRKLHELLKDGILTEEEFNNQKHKLLMR